MSVKLPQTHPETKVANSTIDAFTEKFRCDLDFLTSECNLCPQLHLSCKVGEIPTSAL